MSGNDVGRSIIFVIEPAHGKIFYEARPIDAAQDLIAVLVRAKGRPAAFHGTLPEDVTAFNHHAVGPDLNPAIKLDRLCHDEPVEDAEDEQTDEIEPETVNRRMMKQIP